MAGSGAWKRLKSLLRKDDAPLFLNDTSAFDFSDEVGNEGLSRFNKLRVVVADDGSETPERPINGAHPALQADDDSLLDQDLPLTNSQLSLKVDPCDNKRQESWGEAALGLSEHQVDSLEIPSESNRISHLQRRRSLHHSNFLVLGAASVGVQRLGAGQAQGPQVQVRKAHVCRVGGGARRQALLLLSFESELHPPNAH